MSWSTMIWFLHFLCRSLIFCPVCPKSNINNNYYYRNSLVSSSSLCTGTGRYHIFVFIFGAPINFFSNFPTLQNLLSNFHFVSVCLSLCRLMRFLRMRKSNFDEYFGISSKLVLDDPNLKISNASITNLEIS